MASTSWIEVDLGAVAANAKMVRRVITPRGPLAPSAGREADRPVPGLCAVLKADGYGLGAVRLAHCLARAGVDMLAVYTPDQARALVESAVATPVLLLMPIHDLDRADALYRAASRGQLHLTIHDEATLAAAVSITERLGLRLAVQLEVDTGMSRGGATPAEAGALLKRIASHSRLVLTGVFSHLASADRDEEFTRAQSAAFTRFLSEHRRLIPEDVILHEANTFGTFRSAEFHRTMVRVGLALLGYGGEEFGDAETFEFESEASALTPAMRWLTRIVHIKTVEPNTPVGYGGTWRTDRPARLGLVPVGYADGYPLALSNKASMGVRLADGSTAFAPVVGRVSMDQATIDLTDLPAGVGIGTIVEAVGSDRAAPNHLPALARSAGTITHELLCRLSPRLPRRYLAGRSADTVIPIGGSVVL